MALRGITSSRLVYGCMSLGGDHTLPNSEKAARVQGLGECRAKTPKGQIITQPPGADKFSKMKPQ